MATLSLVRALQDNRADGNGGGNESCATKPAKSLLTWYVISLLPLHFFGRTPSSLLPLHLGVA